MSSDPTETRRTSRPLWLVVLLVAACSPKTAPTVDLGTRLDCLRLHNLAVVAAHRGQPDQSAAENAMSSFTASLAAAVPFLEVDVATTSDGALVLMHDDTLNRTTTGSGPTTSRTLAEVEALKLKRPGGAILDERVPLFGDVLAWGRKVGAYFEVDVKPTTRFEDVVNAVRAAGMENQALIVTYTLEDAKKVHALDTRLMISVTVGKPEDLLAVRAALPLDRVLGWTGTSNPQASLFAALRNAGVEPIFGTLGRAGVRLDDVYAADGSPSEYRDLVRSGVVMIASDAAVAAQRAIGTGYRACFQ
jgi:glycerophosphoryl diester phosphodiesterase